MIAKLVRDNCDAVKAGQCQAANSLAVKHMALLLKIHEETEEIAKDGNSVEEYADVIEALLELAHINGILQTEIEAVVVAKRAAKGGFREAQIWTWGVPE